MLGDEDPRANVPLAVPLHAVVRSFITAVRARDHRLGSWRGYPDDNEMIGYYVERMQQLAREQLHVDQARQALANIQRYSVRGEA